MQLSPSEENYLKSIYKLQTESAAAVGTNDISALMSNAAASVTDMLRRLADKGLINYQKYKGVSLTPEGESQAKRLIRKHRLWEVFLVNKLHFAWDEVHDMAEQLEHIDFPELTHRLDNFLGFPKFDPHGDPIPDVEGNYHPRKAVLLSELPEQQAGVIIGVKDHSKEFLQYLGSQNLVLGIRFIVEKIFAYDQSVQLRLENESLLTISAQVARNILSEKL